ncbi:MAG TPA: Hpt domain-containing protein [Gemmatimonadaceae bacterium]|jgi:two-component system sensor histidine kinase/response regulator|nr:Hpt domain-containing protein [Gemmatimonadaceae bacterium]
MPTSPSADASAVELDRALERLRRFGGDALLRDMIDLFLEHAPKRIAASRQALAANDLAPVRLSVHSLVSSCAQLGAEQMRRLSAEAEQAVATNPGALAGLLEALEREFAMVQPMLAAARPTGEAAS